MATVKRPSGFIEYMCRNCGTKVRRPAANGRPDPGSCKRMNGRPHSWVINRRY